MGSGSREKIGIGNQESQNVRSGKKDGSGRQSNLVSNFSIPEGADGVFRINATSGMLSCKELDREKKAEHFLIISVSDNLFPKDTDVCTVRVIVADENDNAPTFNPLNLQVIEISDLLSVPSRIFK